MFFIYPLTYVFPIRLYEYEYDVIHSTCELYNLAPESNFDFIKEDVV